MTNCVIQILLCINKYNDYLIGFVDLEDPEYN